MHFEILIEDQSGKKFLDILFPNIIGDGHTFKVHAYKGIGRIPKNLIPKINANKRLLLDHLPNLLKGYGEIYSKYPSDNRAFVIVVCDLDDKGLNSFRNELLGLLNACSPKPETRFCFAIEEGEAWFLGDIPAVKKAYPKARDATLSTYENDSICGTWECLADAIYPGGSQALSKKGWQAVGAEKSAWSEKITPHMAINENNSPSFRYFRDKVRGLLGSAENVA
ncbi:MAG: hypothetical protein HQL37_10210 [Alphaproteobacteria bacterium]|nr:hypothetical protein [Alphaproteobacteria bacterium]